MSPRASVSVVIPSVHGGDRLIALVETLVRSPDMDRREVEVIVADNGVPAQTRRRLESAGVRTLAMGFNRGVAAAVNRSAAVAEGTLLALINDDITIGEQFLPALLAPLDDGAPASAGVLLQEESPDVIETAGVVIDRFLGSYDHLQGESVEVLAHRPRAPLGPCGGAAAWRRDIFISLGGFDERFFAYCEDVDLAVRMDRGGIRCAFATAATAHHAGSATLGYHSLAKACRVGASHGALIAKYGLLRRPQSAAWVLATELATSIELGRRHGSLSPGRARISGYLAARRADPTVLDPPGAAAAAVAPMDGLLRRYRRSVRRAAT